MNVTRGGSVVLRYLIVFTVVLGSVALISAPKPTFGEHDKAYYVDEKLLNFIRPGLALTIQSAEIADDGTIKTRIKITDPRGVPLDRLGVVTPGPVSMSVIAGYIPSDGTKYRSYTTRVQTSPITGVAATQAAADSGGTWRQVGEGEYEYTLRTRAPAGFDKTATHSIGVYSTRNLSEFDMPNNWADAVFNFVPNGSAVTKVRDIIKTDTCNKCHDPLAIHGGSRQKVELCIMCHIPSKDPDTGEELDMTVMIHRIHMGANLPSVEAGKPYKIIGNQQSVHDYSNVVMPSDVRRCTFCHEQGKGAKQEKAFLTPTRWACGSCHDNVNFATGENHANLPQTSDNQCANCHTPQGELPFDISIMGAHTIPEHYEGLPGVVFDFVRVTGTSAGQRPVVTFNVKNNKGEPYNLPQFSRLAIVMAGPTSDYAQYFTEDPRNAATRNGDGSYTYTFNTPIPAGQKGTWSMGLEGYNNFTILPGTTKAVTVRDAGVNKVTYFSVDGSAVARRREVVSLAKCNDCHAFLSLHGGNRNTVEQCVLCHAPNTTDAAVRPAGQMPAESIQMANMIHKIHTGHLIQDEDYTIYGRGSVAHNYNHVGYPGDRRNCNACHVNNSQQVPLPKGLLPVQDPRGLINPMQPTAAACLGCHTSVDAASHALVNTSTIGESCGACHGVNRDKSVNRAHAR